MPAGQVIARHGEIGTQAATLMPGLYWRMPVVWSMRRSKVVQVGETEIATVEAIDGRPLPKGRLLGDEVECNQFQDGEAFLRSEEHTSELQSLRHLVCRLLLEKK